MTIVKTGMHKFPVRMSIAWSSPLVQRKKLCHRNCTSKRLSTVNNSRVIFRRSRLFWRKISWITTVAITIQISKDRSKIRMSDLIIETSQEKVWVTRSSHMFPKICLTSSKRRLLMMIAIVMFFQRLKNTITKVDSVNFKALPVLATKVKIKKTHWVPPKSILTRTIMNTPSNVRMYQRLLIQFSPLASWTRKPHHKRWIIRDKWSRLTKSIRDRPWVRLSMIGITVSIIFTFL